MENYTLPIEETIALVRQFPTPEFMLRRFFPEIGLTGKTATWTMYPNTRERAKYVPFNAASDPQARRPMSHKAAQMAHIRLSKYIGAASKWNRRPGSNQTNEKWAVQDQISDEMEELNRQIEYAKEVERASVLFGGILTLAYADGSYDKVDYATSVSTHYRALVSNWSYVGCDIIGDLQSAIHAVQVDGGFKPTAAIGYDGMINDFIRNTVLQNYMKESPDGIRALERGAWPRLMGMDIMTYDAGYTEGGTWKSFVPEGLVCLLGTSEQTGTVMLQGEADDLKAAGNPGRFSKSWETEDPSGIHVLIDDVSLPIIEVPTGVCVIDAYAV